MTTSYGYDQDAEPPTPDGTQPDLVETDDQTGDETADDVDTDHDQDAEPPA